jgi:hypothetical protein
LSRQFGAGGVEARAVVPWQLCCVPGAGFLVPDIEGVGPEFAIDAGCQLVSVGTEVAVDEGAGLPGRC